MIPEIEKPFPSLGVREAWGKMRCAKVKRDYPPSVFQEAGVRVGKQPKPPKS